MQPGFGGSIGQPEGTVRTADFRDSDGDGTDDRDQRRPGGRNIVEKRRRRATKDPGYRPPAGPPGYTYPGMPPRTGGDNIYRPTPAPDPRPFPGKGGGYKGELPPMRPPGYPSPGGGETIGGGRPPMRPPGYPSPGGDDVRDIRGTNDPRNRKGRDKKRNLFNLGDINRGFYSQYK